MKGEINIIFSNDVHGNYNSFNAMDIIKRKIDNSICIDCGDTFSYDFQGKIIRNMMNKVLDLWLPGNHDLETHYNNFKDICNDGNIDVILSNVKKNPQFQVKKNIIKNVNGINILFLGCCTFSFNENIEFTDLAREVIEIINKEKDKADLVFFLSHLGINEDIRLAESLPEIDVIFGGHSHTRINGAKLVNKTLIVQAGGFGKEIGVLSLGIKNRKIISFESELIKVDEYEPQKELLSILSDARSNYESFMNIKCDINYGKYNDNPFTEHFLKILLNRSSADGVILNSSLINVELTRGNITIEDVKRIIGYETDLFNIFLSGLEINNIIKRSEKEKYFKLHFLFKEKIDKNKNYNVVITDFLAKGGHYGGSVFPEFREKNKKVSNLNIIEIAKKSLEEGVYV